jgi:hypothetical protein
LANAIEQRGFFWWFNEPTRPANSKQTSVPGMLIVTQTGQTTLELDGCLAEDQEHAVWAKPRSFGSSRIVGLLDTPDDYVLLEGLERTDFSVSDEGPKKQSFTASSCTRRQFEFPNDYKQSGFTELRVDLKGLEEWLELDSILVERDYGQPRSLPGGRPCRYISLGLIAALLSVSSDANNHNLPQSRRLLYCVNWPCYRESKISRI